MRDRLHFAVLRLTLWGVAFFLPVFGRAVPLFILLMVVNWLATPSTYKRSSWSGKSVGWTMAFSLIYFAYIAGLLNTVNFGYAFFDLQVKLSLLIFPMVFATAPPLRAYGERIRELVPVFIAGCIAGALLLLGRAFYLSVHDGIDGAFYYTALSWYFHSSYLSLYYAFAVGSLLFLSASPRPSLMYPRWLAWPVIGFLSLMVLLLASKAGWISLAFTFLFRIYFLAFRERELRKSLTLLVIGVSVFVAGYLVSPVAVSRIAKAGKVIQSGSDTARKVPESSADRLVVWSVAGDIVLQHPLTGVGTGDIKDELLKGYETRHALPAIEHKYNAHSQYLQTAATLGIPGLLILLAMLAWPLGMALKRSDHLYALFLAVTVLNLLTESMLEVQAGVVFYAFFNIVLFVGMKNGDPETRTPA